MKTGPLLVIGLALALRGASAQAAGDPLLVVVEAPPDLEMDAGDVRRAIGAELQEPTRAPVKVVGDPAQRLLIVAVGHERITMSLRESSRDPIARVIPTPADPAARLRAIAWLAGNLARDQVATIVAQQPESPPAPEPPRPPPPPAVEPPRFEAPATAPTIAARAEAAPTVAATGWTLGAVAGPAISLYETGHSLRQSVFGAWNLGDSLYDVFARASTIWRVEARHQNAGSRMFTGLALEGSSQTSLGGELVGALAFAGTSRRLGGWTFAAHIGAGVDLDRQVVENFLSTSMGALTTSQTLDVRPGLFAAGTASISYRLSESFEAALGLDVHASVTDEYDGYLAATLGLRYRL